jgi:WD40 repeat protein
MINNGRRAENPSIPLFLREVGKYYWNQEMESKECLTGELNEKKNVCTIQYSPDGRFLALGDSDGRDLVYTEGKVKQFYQETKRVMSFNHSNSFSFSPDSKFLASDSIDGVIRVWNTETWELKMSLGQTLNTLQVRYSPCGQFLASVSVRGRVQIWELKTQKNIEIPESLGVVALVYSPCGQFLAFGDFNSIKIWSIKSQEYVQTMKHVDGRPTCLQYSPDGKFLAGSFRNNSILVWHVETGELSHAFVTTDWVNSISYSPCGRFLASGSHNKTVQIWKIREKLGIYKKPKYTFKNPGGTAVLCVSYSPCGRFVASGTEFSGGAHIWKIV